MFKFLCLSYWLCFIFFASSYINHKKSSPDFFSIEIIVKHWHNISLLSGYQEMLFELIKQWNILDERTVYQ